MGATESPYAPRDRRNARIRRYVCGWAAAALALGALGLFVVGPRMMYAEGYRGPIHIVCDPVARAGWSTPDDGTGWEEDGFQVKEQDQEAYDEMIDDDTSGRAERIYRKCQDKRTANSGSMALVLSPATVLAIASRQRREV